MRLILRVLGVLVCGLGLAALGLAQPFFFTTGDTDGLIAVASRPASADGSKFEIEAADDFILSSEDATLRGCLHLPTAGRNHV